MEPTGTTDPTDIQALHRRVEMLTDVLAESVAAMEARNRDAAKFHNSVFVLIVVLGAIAIYRSHLDLS